jgi:hypothetical protein
MGLWLKNEDGFVPVSGGGGAGGTAGPHDHDDYLPLAGGTLTGDLKIDMDSNLTISPYNQKGLVIDRTAHPNVPGLVEFMPSYEADVTTGDIKVDGNGVVRFRGDKFSRFYGDLQVDGTAILNGDALVGFRIKSEYTRDNPATSGAPPNLHISTNGFIYKSDPGSMFAFAASKLTRDSDVLERADTATLPPEMQTDDDGNVLNTAEIEAHDTVQLFDVVTALLAKVKELSAEIEELKAKDRPLKKQAAPRKKAATRKTTTAKKEDS